MTSKNIAWSSISLYCVEIIVISGYSYNLRVVKMIFFLSEIVSGINPPCVIDLRPLPIHPWIQSITTCPGYVRVLSRIIVRIETWMQSPLSEIVLLHEHPWSLTRIHLLLPNQFVLLHLNLLLDRFYLLHTSYPDLFLLQILYLFLHQTLIWLMLVIVAVKSGGLLGLIFMMLLLL